MTEQLVEFETAKLAREKRFDWIESDDKWYGINGNLDFSFQGYNENTKYRITAPTQSLLQKWLREEHQINVESNYLPNIQKYRCLYVPMTKAISNKEKYSLRSKYYGIDAYETYEEALEKGLQEALKLI